MILAIPITGENLTPQFGQCDSYLFVDIDLDSGTVVSSRTAVAPPHAPDHLPDWIVKQGADTVICPKVPNNFRSLMEFHGLNVIEHPDSKAPLDLIKDFLNGDFDENSSG